MANNEKRFVKVYEQGVLECFAIYADRETGVQYIYTAMGNGAGFTPLLGPDSKPLLAEQPIEEWDKKKKKERNPWA